ncbi:hypothetical protein [Alkalibacillus salilacus]|uniref:Uncharacterized protein n=1 Tax=Alkalibacillus salilacus TaxID=284582 RepID=A0ABT9VII9_9BACI|nr:hypothetical protein [Alkalibacillus salilacus]MDQ0160776.1 hypothetical protein [Alkalibacillus salilacus]
MRLRIKFLLIASIGSSLMILMLKFFHWTLNELLSPFLFFVFSTFAYSAFLIVAAIALVVLFSHKDWKHMVIQGVAVMLFFLIPFDQVVLEADYHSTEEQRAAVVDMVLNEELAPTNSGHVASIIELPDQYKHLSVDGEIYIEIEEDRTSLLFLSDGRFLDSFAGIVYSSTNEEPQTGDFNGHYLAVNKLEDHWFSVSAG